MGCSSSSATQETAIPRQLPHPVRHQPIVKPNPYRHGSPITLDELNRQRRQFWETRVDGSQLMWQGIRTAAEALLENDVELARAILEASNILTPNASLDTCYDERGHQYKVPVFLFSNPIEIVGNPVGDAAKKAETEKRVSAAIAAGSGAPINVRVRINPGDHNLTIAAKTSDTILEFKKRVYEKTIQDKQADANSRLPDCTDTRQRVMFLGRELQNNSLLGANKMDGQQVVQIFLRPTPSN